jgi:hypothetical protein
MNMAWLWIKNSDGEEDTMLTFAVVAFVVVLFKVMMGGTDWTIGNLVWKIMPIDATMVAALLGPTLGAYVARRYTDRKFIDANRDGIDDAAEVKTP